MSVPATVWIVVGLGATALVAVLLVALVRQGLLVGRTAMRLARELGEASEGIGSAGGGRATRR